MRDESCLKNQRDIECEDCPRYRDDCDGGLNEIEDNRGDAIDRAYLDYKEGA